MSENERRKKVGVYIDGSNIYYGGRKAGWQLDYTKLKVFIERKYEIATINYYNSIGYEKDEDGKYIKDLNGNYIFNQATLRFENYLRKVGIKVISKPLKFVKSNESIATNKLDGNIMIDALLDQNKWDELILMSGDSDFEKLVKEITKMGKKTTILSFKSRISHELFILSLNSVQISFIALDRLKNVIQNNR